MKLSDKRWRGVSPAVGVIGLLAAAAFLATACGKSNPSAPAAPAAAKIDLSSLRPSFEFGGGIVFQSDLDGDNDIYLLTGTGLRRLTDDPASDEFPKWSPDGRSIVFSSGTEHYPTQGIWSLAIVRAATKRVVPLFGSGARDVFPDWR